MGAGASIRRDRPKPERTKKIDKLLIQMHHRLYKAEADRDAAYLEKNALLVYDDWLQGNCRLSKPGMAENAYDRVYVNFYASLDHRNVDWNTMVAEEQQACRQNFQRIANEVHTKSGRVPVELTDRRIIDIVNEWARPGSVYPKGSPVTHERVVVEACINNYLDAEFKLINLWPIERILRNTQ